MKQLLAILLCLVTLLSLAACSNSDTQSTDPSTEVTIDTECRHTYKDATCTAPKTCSKCNTTEGSAAGHSWKNATCIAPKTCSICNISEGTQSAHSFENGKCSICEKEDMVNPKEHFKFTNYINIEASGDTLVVSTFSLLEDGEYLFQESHCYNEEHCISHNISDNILNSCDYIDYEGDRYYALKGDSFSLPLNLTDTYIEFGWSDSDCIKYILQHNGTLRLISGTDSYYPQLLTPGSLEDNGFNHTFPYG